LPHHRGVREGQLVEARILWVLADNGSYRLPELLIAAQQPSKQAEEG
jgi:hypothetical protein